MTASTSSGDEACSWVNVDDAAGRSRSLITRIFRPARLAKLAVIVGVVALFPYLVQRLPNLGTRPEYRVVTRQIRLIPEPHAPVPSNLLEQVAELGKLPREFSLLDDKLTANVARAFLQHPWIAKVVSVKKSSPATVSVEVEYRQPVGMVQVKGGRFPIDAAGVVLPPADFTADDAKVYPLIQGLEPPKGMRPGKSWKTSGLIAAARLAELLAPKWNGLQLESIVVPKNSDSQSDPSRIVLELRSRGGSKIIWGRSPETDYPGELTPVQKVGRLEKYLAEFGGFDRPTGPYEIDIRHWQEISRRPLATQQAKSQGQGRQRR